MATDKPRITITLTVEQYALLTRLSALQKAPKARIVSEMLGEVFPVLEKVAEALEMAQRASAGARATFKRAAEQAEEDIRPLAEFARDQFDLFARQLGDLVNEGEQRGAEEPREGEADRGNEDADTERGGAALSPRPVITGATVSTKAPEETGKRSKGGAKRATLKPKHSKDSGYVRIPKVFADADNNGAGARLLIQSTSKGDK